MFGLNVLKTILNLSANADRLLASGNSFEVLKYISLSFRLVDLSGRSGSRVNLGDADFAEYSFNLTLIAFFFLVSRKMFRLFWPQFGLKIRGAGKWMEFVLRVLYE